MSATLTKEKVLEKNVSVNKNLNFKTQIIKKEEQKKVEVTTDHYFIVDCSGSMYSDIGAIRKQLKNKLPALLTAKTTSDTFTIVYFSGKGQYGVLQDHVEVKSLLDFNSLNKAIDQLHTIGLTAFKEPLDEVGKLITERRKTFSNRAYSIFFLTDGYDNCWNESEILSSVEKLKPIVSNAIFVEYGYYANKELLSKMAEAIGGTSIFAENFYNYEPIFEKAINSQGSAEKVEIELSSTPLYGLVYSINASNNIVTYKVEEGNKILAGEDVTQIHYFTNKIVNETIIANKLEPLALVALTSSLYLFSQKGDSETAYNLLSYLGDVNLIDMYSKAIGKQPIATFEKEILNIIETKELFKNGYNANYIPKEDIYCLLNLLEDLMSSPENKWCPNHPDLTYKAIGAGTIQKTAVLSPENKVKLDILNESLANTKKKADKAKIQEQIDEINSSVFSLKFNVDKYAAYPISDLVLNEDRPNISVRVTRKGTVTGLPENQWGIKEFASMDIKNYTLVADGIKNMSEMFVKLSKATFDKLVAEKLIDSAVTYSADEIYKIDLTQLEVVNRKMTKASSAKDMFMLAYKIQKQKADVKVFDYFKKQIDLETTKFDKNLFESKEQEEWFANLGIASLYNPATDPFKNGDCYTATLLPISIKGLSSIGKVEDAVEKLKAYNVAVDKSKVKVSANLFIMFEAIERYNAFLASDTYTKAKNKDQTLFNWLEANSTSLKTVKNELMSNISKIKFAIIMGKTWFTDFANRNENTMDLDIDGNTISFTVKLDSKTITT